jgi:hypothetical protein
MITVLHSYQISKIWTKSLKLKYQLQIEYPLTVELNQEEGLRSASKLML